MNHNTFFFPRWVACVALVAGFALQASAAGDAKVLSALLIDGQNNHKWQETTPLIKQTLEASGRFQVDVATSPAKGGDMSTFAPNFADYDVVVSNYNGQPWSESTQKAFEDYVAGGGGFCSVHAADNSFPKWSAYNRMIGLGGWGGRNESDGPYVRWKEDQQKFTRDNSPGSGGAHGKRIPFVVVVRDREHPITKGLPGSFMQTADELYAKLRGPAENMNVLATGFSAKKTGGTDEHEPLLMTIQYGKGRVFHTTLGHDVNAMKGLAFQVTLQRGTEWAATGKVTLPAVDAETLTADQPALRDPSVSSPSASSPSASGSDISWDSIPDIDGEGWVSLFNGSDTKGWTQKNGTATYRVEDGAVVGKTSEGSPNSFLCTDQSFGDFELTFETNVDTGLNSGVQIRSVSSKEYKNGRVHGPQVEIEAAPGEAGYVYSEGTGRGWITKEQPIKDAYKNNSWNRFVVRAVGDRIQTWVNGTKIADFSDAESSKEGFFGLQVHGIAKGTGPFQVRWKDIRVRELK
ncbi:family 16 glycoside hydrolase [Novipirellula sp.]|uniref:family 16 glycoside hydrolase n=1 Tax=Novipirellula sp. TaxID=2795430 RepID=UPI003565F80C